MKFEEEAIFEFVHRNAVILASIEKQDHDKLFDSLLDFFTAGIEEGKRQGMGKAAEIAETFDTAYDQIGDELMRRGDAALEVADAIRAEINGKN